MKKQVIAILEKHNIEYSPGTVADIIEVYQWQRKTVSTNIVLEDIAITMGRQLFFIETKLKEGKEAKKGF